MILRGRFVALVLFGTFGVIQQATADWPTFRGADRTAVSKETDLLQSWPEGGPSLLWKAEGFGRGYTSVAIANGRGFLVGDGISGVEDKDVYLVAFDIRDGKRLWASKLSSLWTEQKNVGWQSPRSTPTIDENRVYVLTERGDLICSDVETGKELWRKSFEKDFGGKKADPWGYSESVLIDGKQLVCTPGGDKTTMVALDKLTGNTIWSTVRGEDRGAGHASIVISKIGDVRVYVQTTGGGALGVRASDGKLLWSYPIDKTTAVIPTPIVRDDLVFISAGYGRGGALLKQSADGAGGVTMSEVYPLKKELGNKHGGVLLVGDYLYGDTDSSGIPFCASLTTGDIKWNKTRPAGGSGTFSIAAADDRLYLHFEKGTMVLAKVDPESFVEVSSFTIPGSGERPSWSHPVIFDGKLYLRENNTVLCYDIREKSPAAKSSGN